MQKINGIAATVRKVNDPVRFSDLKSAQASKIAAARISLVNQGYGSLQKQADALGLSRSSAWNLLRGNYKASGLSANTIKKILSSPTLPQTTRELIQEYVKEKLLGAYGHSPQQLKRFRQRLGHQCSQGLVGVSPQEPRHGSEELAMTVTESAS